MSRLVYLIRNGDLYKIGTTNDLDRELKLLQPDEIVKTLQTTTPNSIQARLFKKFKSKRLPGTQYFRLAPSQVQECRALLSTNTRLPLSIKEEVTIAITGSILLLIISFLVSFIFHLKFLLGMSIAIFLASIPMWILFSTGSFGGFDADDVPLFSTFLNRVKALFIALSMTSMASIFYYFYRIF